jgi:hypothetical protein
MRKGDHLLRVAGEISYRGIDLAQGDFHNLSLKRGPALAKSQMRDGLP